ncbi:cysteine-rich KTR domain-containing protein [Roseburia hominis]|uniref:cysteine-rich KTR domain-containing protein n=1 Tax=Roseburia hominis TaxID=301301 RepID=UPI00266BF201|nr:cysteine-rich KTR domain-containing protein [Roseburia hominis]
MKHTYSWQSCPICGNPKAYRVRDDTKAERFPVYCKRCKRESLITIAPKSRIMSF